MSTRKYQPALEWLNRHWRRTLYSRIENIFSYENLPEEINERAFKLGLFKFGKVLFFKINDKMCVQPFAYTDRLDWYYIPKFGRVVNPWLPQGKQNFEFEVDKEAVVWNSTPDIYNIRENSVISDLIFKTAAQLSENDLSYYCIQRNSRLIAMFTADNDIEKAEANRVIEKMYAGDPDITMQQDIVSRIQAMSISENSMRGRLTELVEFQQYILANFYHAFGINSNYNLKREQLNSNEIDVNKEVLRLNIEDLLKCRELGVSKVNEIYNTDIRVSLNEEVYASLLKEQEVILGANNSANIRNESKTSEGVEDASGNTVGTGESENEDKQGDVRTESDDVDTRADTTGQDDGKSDTGTGDSEQNETPAEVPNISVQIKAENVEEIIVENEPNLSEKGDKNDDVSETDDTERMEDEKSER